MSSGRCVRGTFGRARCYLDGLAPVRSSGGLLAVPMIELQAFERARGHLTL